MGLVEIPIDCHIDNFGSWEVDMLRHIRNECRAGFSHDNEYIDIYQHENWWHKNCKTLIASLYCACGGYATELDLAGYGLLRADERSRWYSSVAVLPDWSGHGIGGEITDRIIRRGRKVYASARLDNPAAMALHRAEDWEETHRDDRLAYYVTRPDYHSNPIRRARV